ncbi:ricin-type beta-trefoil lectin domain protein [Streptomyces pseudogriseolus]|uniref:ricin-type beta-trefoil lectin domain protein n=1 Tax=Streptomyces pseudogriseolus TaxID=36817 RepID=UPI001CE24624|nr:ricin-type beta-trefoil lectin domain protein [Streptomyces pseudogriseolus]
MCALAAAWAAVVAVPAGSASAQPHPVAADAGTDYVAMGSSFAAGPGIPPLQSSDGASACGRSAVNYPSIVAREIGADLTDVSCSGATTAHVLRDPQGARPPQIQAVTPDTRLVTITIGGNDVNYLGSINAYSCQASGGSGCPTVDRDAIERTFPELPGRIADIVRAAHAVAPQARVHLVTYFTLLPDSGTCAVAPLTDEQAAYERSIAARLAAATADAAAATGATLVDLAGASRGHDACSADPWVESYRPAQGRSTYHPNEAGMRAAADLVQSALASGGVTRTAAFRSGIPGKCIDVRDAASADGTPVQLYTCNGTAAQRWTYVPGEGGTLRALGRCLDVSGGGTANGTKVQLWQCNGTGAQRWIPGPASSLINPQSGRCLDDPGASTADRTQLQIHDCNATGAQRWTPTAAGLQG